MFRKFRNWFSRVDIIHIESQILTLNPDEVLVLSYDYYLSDGQVETLKKQLYKFPSDKQRILLLEGGGKLSILR